MRNEKFFVGSNWGIVFPFLFQWVLIGGLFSLPLFRGSNWGIVFPFLFQGALIGGPFLFVLLRAEGKFCKKIKKNKNNFLKY